LSIVTNPAHGNGSLPICELSLINVHPRPEKDTFLRRKKLIRNQNFSPTDQSCTVVLCWSIIDYSVARYVALFRLHENVHYLDVHYLSDVVFGAAVGTICGTHGDSARSVKLCDVADCHDSRRRI